MDIVCPDGHACDREDPCLHGCARFQLASPTPLAEVGLSFGVDLASGAHLKVQIPSLEEQVWIFQYRYHRRNEHRRIDLVNDVQLEVPYLDGFVEARPAEFRRRLTLSMNVVLPAKLGVRFFLGVDISPDAKTFLQFHYEPDPKNEEVLRLVEVEVGAQHQFRLDAMPDGLIRPIDFPFPVQDTILPEFGDYRVPFLDREGQIAYFVFPLRTRRLG